MRLRLVVVTLSAIALLGIGGCGTKGPKLIKISGVVKFSDGSFIPVPGADERRPPATITFTPADTGAEGATGEKRKGASGKIGADGRFEMMTIKPGDGVVPGKYKVFITAVKVYGDPKSSLVPQKYTKAETSGFEITVDKAKSDVEFTLEK